MSRITQLRNTLLLSALTAWVGACGVETEGNVSTRGVAQAAPATPVESVASETAVQAAPPEMVKTAHRAEPGVAAAAVTYEEAEASFRSGDYAAATDLFASYVEGRPGNAWGHYMLGLAAWRAGDSGRAEEAMLRASEIDPENVKVRVNLGRILLDGGRAEEALPHLETAVELSSDSDDAWRVMGNIRSELGRNDEALSAYERALAINDKDTWSMNNYGLVLIRLGRYEEALPPLARAVELKPDSPVFQNNLGVALERSGYPGSASKAFAAALEADSTYTRASISLERVKSLLGESHGEEVDLTSLATEFIEKIGRS
jgi:predicted Zn-dependent protease